jgi:hypothetical protein
MFPNEGSCEGVHVYPSDDSELELGVLVNEGGGWN